MNLFKLFGTIAINSREANAEFDSVQGKAKETEGRFGSVGKAAGSMGKAIKAAALVGATAIAGIGAAALKFGGDFKEAFNTIKAGTGATGENLEGLKDDFKAVFADVPVDMQSAASAIADFNTLTGATGEDLQELSKQALNAGRAFGSDVPSLIDSAGKAFNIFELDAKEGAEALDVFAKISQDTGVDLNKLAGQVQTFGPVLKNAGFDVNETAAFFGELSKAGIDVTRVMPAINASMRKAAQNGVQDLKGHLSDTIESIRDAETSTEALALATEAFGAEGAQRMTTAIRNGALSIDDLAAAAEGAEGTILDTATATEGMGEKFTRLKNNVLVALEPLLSRLFEGMLRAMDWLTPKITDFTRNVMPEIQRVIEGRVMPAVDDVAQLVKGVLIPAFEDGVSLIKSDVLPVFQEIFDFLSPAKKEILIGIAAAIGTFLVAAFGALAVSAGAAAVAVIAAIAPFIAVGVAIAALVAGIALLIKHWDEVKAVIIRVASDIHAKIEETFPGITLIITTAFNTAKTVITDFVSGVLRVFMSAVGGVVDFVRDNWPTISDVIAFAVDFVVTKIEGMIQVVRGIIEIIAGVIQTVDALFKGDWAAAWDGMKMIAEGILDLLIGSIKTTFGSIPGVIYGLAGDAAKAASEFAKSISNAIMNWLNELPGKAAKVFQDIAIAAASAIPGAGIVASGIGLVTGGWPFNADGTRNWPGGLTWVGERGPELVNIPRGADIFSNEESASMSGGARVNVYVDKLFARDEREGRRSGNDIGFAIASRGLNL